MMRHAAATTVAVLLLAACAGGAAPGLSVSSQGLLAEERPAGSGELNWSVSVEDRASLPFSARVLVVEPGGEEHSVEAKGEGFLVSRLGLVIAVRSPETAALPSTIEVLDLDGASVWSREIWGLVNPTLSDDGSALAYVDGEGTKVTDLLSFETTSYPRLSPFAVSADGRLAGVRERTGARGSAEAELVVFDGEEIDVRMVFPRTPRRVAFAPRDRAVLVLSGRALTRVDDGGGSRVFYAAPEGTELRDLALTDEGLAVGLRRATADTYTGSLVVLDDRGKVVRTQSGPSRAAPAAQDSPGIGSRDAARGIPWPLAPDAQHTVGNTYGEYQSYGGDPYLHPGADVMGASGQPVYAVAPGVVKAILTTSGQWHWRVAVADSATNGTSTGYLYAHLDESSIAVGLGDTVELGEHLGDLVTWPVSEFHHVHFARVEDSGAQWYGSWLSIDNPHVDFSVQTESASPVFEPARGSDLLAFCANETSTYQDPGSLSGAVDIIAHVGDRIESNWVCTVQEIRYTIYPDGYPEHPVVDDRLAVNFDMALDTYQGGPIDPFLVDLLYKQDVTCQTQGNYDYREFYHVITNSDGDEVYDSSDLAEAWDTTALPDADYVIRVTATDVAGNATVDSMTVATANGNPTWVPPSSQPRISLGRPFPNPSIDRATLSFSLASEGRAELVVYDASGRLVRTIARAWMPQGRHIEEWNLRDSSGIAVATGVYFVRLSADGRTRTRKLAVGR